MYIKDKKINFPKELFEFIKTIDQRLENNRVNLRGKPMSASVAAIVKLPYYSELVEMVIKHYQRKYGVKCVMQSYSKSNIEGFYTYVFNMSK